MDHDNALELDLAPQPLAVSRLEPMASVPAWVAGDLVSVTRTAEELSIVCAADAVPIGTWVEGPFRGLAVRGPRGPEVTGLLAALTGPLAEAGIPVLALSTFGTDILLVPGDRVEAAVAALTDAGHHVHQPG